MRQYALVGPKGYVSAMATEPEALEEILEEMPDVEGWEVQRCDLCFWLDHPELCDDE